MIGSSPALNLSEVGKTSYHCHSEEEKKLIRDTIPCIRCPEIKKGAIILREKALKSDLERCHIAIAPQLPYDILCLIFELHCQDELPAKLSFGSKPPQVILSHVCLAWRRAVLDFPKLWSNIVIDIIVPQSPHWVCFDKVVEIANAWLSRAKDLPCSTEFKFPQSEYDSEFHSEVDSEPVWRQDWHLNIIKNFISRHKFKRLGVTFADHHLQDLLQLPDEKLSCIEDLCLQHIIFENDRNSELPDFHKLVNLTSFSLLPIPFVPVWTPGQGGHILRFSNTMPWHQLRHIQIRVDVPALFCLTMMERSLATLETCSLVVSNIDWSVPLPFSCQEPLHCRRLRDFTVDVVSPPYAVKALDRFLLSLRLPNLKSLTIGRSGSCDYPRIPIHPRTLVMMQNSIPNMCLEELVISDTALDIRAEDLLKLFPSLRRLEFPFRNVTFTAATMRELGAGSIGANLEDLKIHDAGLVQGIVTLLQMVKTRSSNRKEDNMRRAKPTPFKSVVLYCGKARNTDDTEIDQLMEEIDRLGVSLKVIFADESGWEQ